MMPSRELYTSVDYWMPHKVATLRTGEKPVHDLQMPVAPQDLVFQLSTEFAEGCIHDRSAQLGSRHAFYIQVFDADQVKTSNKIRRHLVNEIIALPGHLLMNPAQTLLGFLAPVGAFLPARKDPLRASHFPVRLAGKLRSRKIAWRDVWVGSVLTSILFVLGKLVLALYLGSGTAGSGSAYGAASSLIILLLWIYYSA